LKDKPSPHRTRREFLASSAAVAASLISTRLVAQNRAALMSPLALDPQRPQFHLLPTANWMNDPNGPIYFSGHYHMFFQYNPQAAIWGNMSWNHAVSPDMIHWAHQPLAMTPTPGGPDAAGCFSGTSIAVGRRVYAIYTGVVESTPDKVTLHDGSDKLRESQCLAWSDDPDLIHWTKLPQPVIPDPPLGIKITGFRDPSPWKQGNAYYMTVGAGIARVGGCVLLYRSDDLKHWTYLHQLTSGQWNGKPTPNPCDDGEMWECPDFFQLDGGHVLIYSTLGKVFWQSGSLDAATMLFHPVKTGELDLGAFYAPKTQLDANGRRILWGWITEQRPEAQYSAAGWAGMMSLPRVLHLDKSGTLRMEILPTLATLRSSPVPPQETRAGILKTLRQASGEVLCTGAKASDITLTFSDGTSELLRVEYSNATHAFTVAGKHIALEPDDLPTIHAFVDASAIELILGERIGYTSRFYSSRPTAPDILVHATGTTTPSMSAWNLTPISANRLTTPARET
jgi:beta-fructofuranosidase